MVVIGLTGSIAMGKTTVAGQFSLCGAKISNSDKIVHELLQSNKELFSKISELFPDAIENNQINRNKLAKIVFDDKNKLKILESIIHPLVLKKHLQYIKRAKYNGFPLVVLEIPLLFESKMNMICDITIVVTAPEFIQRQRALSRIGMNEDRFEKIKQYQLDDRIKQKLADIVINTGNGKYNSFMQVKHIIKNLRLL